MKKNAQNLVKVDDQFPFSSQIFTSLVNTESSKNAFPYIDFKPNFKALGKIRQPILFIYDEFNE